MRMACVCTCPSIRDPDPARMYAPPFHGSRAPSELRSGLFGLCKDLTAFPSAVGIVMGQHRFTVRRLKRTQGSVGTRWTFGSRSRDEQACSPRTMDPWDGKRPAVGRRRKPKRKLIMRRISEGAWARVKLDKSSEDEG